MKTKVCCLCGKIIGGDGHNPWPFDISVENPECCDDCNEEHVIPAIKAAVKFLIEY